MDNKILYTAKFTHHDLKFHKDWQKSDKRFESWSGQTDRQTDRQADSYIPPKLFLGGINIIRISSFDGSGDLSMSVGNNIIDSSHNLIISIGNNIMYLFIVHQDTFL
jgi:hypothetical protein